MEILKVTAENFMSYEFLEFELKDRGLVLVEGENRDDGASNGSGKSSIFDSITFCLFGYTSRYGKSLSDCVRRDNTHRAVGNTRVSIELAADGKLVKVDRYREHKEKGNKLFLTIDGRDVTAGSDKETQRIFEEAIQLDLETFLSSVMYPQKAAGFASLSDAEQKAIFDRVLGTEIYVKAQEQAKEKLSTFQSHHANFVAAITYEEKQLQQMQEVLSNLKAQEENFVSSKEAEIKSVERALQEHKANEPIQDKGWEKKLADLELEIEHLRADDVRDIYDQTSHKRQGWITERSRLMGVIEQYASEDFSLLEEDLGEPLDGEALDTELSVCRSTVSNAKLLIQQAERDIKKLEEKYNTVQTHCPTCNQALPSEGIEKVKKEIENEANLKRVEINYLNSEIKEKSTRIEELEKVLTLADKQFSQKKLREKKEKYDQYTALIEELDVKIGKANALIEETRATIDLDLTLRNKHAEFLDKIHRKQDEIRVWKLQLVNLQKDLEKAIQAVSPYLDLIDQQEVQIQKVSKSITTKKQLRDFYSKQIDLAKFWVTGFGNGGVKSLLLDEVTPFLNERANEYLQELRPGAKIEFSTQKTLASGEKRDKFEVKVTLQNADSYKGCSGGEQQRVDLAVMLALGDLAASRSFLPINFRLLDECFDGLDSLGQEQVANLLQNKIVPRCSTIFVMSHSDNLKQHFMNRIKVVKQHGISKLEE